MEKKETKNIKYKAPKGKVWARERYGRRIHHLIPPIVNGIPTAYCMWF